MALFWPCESLSAPRERCYNSAKQPYQHQQLPTKTLSLPTQRRPLASGGVYRPREAERAVSAVHRSTYGRTAPIGCSVAVKRGARCQRENNARDYLISVTLCTTATECITECLAAAGKLTAKREGSVLNIAFFLSPPGRFWSTQRGPTAARTRFVCSKMALWRKVLSTKPFSSTIARAGTLR